ncbi:hypothetical protein SLEP1_g10632 [Rubroshorea leprosula]|uniref:Uncharacterized protein n=1 Tax=Rubroshorea leprosula TaxID=152421 RepID=A0AAV5IGK9_9ROSI|nr:hypothetical protein SLEP1_g10632 [Rubroshorea leprosula]
MGAFTGVSMSAVVEVSVRASAFANFTPVEVLTETLDSTGGTGTGTGGAGSLCQQTQRGRREIQERQITKFRGCAPMVTSYAKLMDNLIDTVEDIDTLRKSGIICNSLNPRDATKFSIAIQWHLYQLQPLCCHLQASESLLPAVVA